jgi:hypothetical protein
MANIGGALARDTEVRLPKTMKVKSKAAAPRQITAEQILREAKEIQLEDDFKAPKTIITDPEELAEYRWVVWGSQEWGSEGVAAAAAPAAGCSSSDRGPQPVSGYVYQLTQQQVHQVLHQGLPSRAERG